MAWSTPKSWNVGDVLTAADMNQYVRDQFNAVAPVGSYILVAANATTVETTLNGGWLECNGVSVLRATYPSLSSYLSGLTPSYPFGSADGTHMTLPPASGRTLVTLAGAGGHTDVTTLGNNDGVALANRRPKHRHAPHSHGTSTGTTFIGLTGTSGNNTGSNAMANQQNQLWSAALTGTADGGSGNANDSLDAPAYLVAGVLYIKF